MLGGHPSLVQNMAFSNTWLRHGFFRVEFHVLLDHHCSHFVIWTTTDFVLLILVFRVIRKEKEKITHVLCTGMNASLLARY